MPEMEKTQGRRYRQLDAKRAGEGCESGGRRLGEGIGFGCQDNKKPLLG